MPNGNTHDKITLFITPILVIIMIMLSLLYFDILIIISGFLFSSFMFNGDLDIRSKPYNRWLIFKYYWIPYQRIFHHRSIFTHGIIIGTIIRIIYCIPILFLIFHFFNVNFFTFQFLLFLCGIEIGNIIHTLSDKIF
jgi:uncharacterized metal-binding protein